MLKVNNLTLSRSGRNICRGVTFELLPGEVLQLSGPNGAGKSSIVLAIAGNLGIVSGEIKFNGRLGVLLQNIELDFAITVREFLLMASPKADISAAINALHLSELVDQRITEISMGQLQRVELAQLLLQDPDIFILDEPFSAQDDENVSLIFGILQQLKARGKSLLLISHIDNEIGDLTDKVYYLPKSS